MRISDWSSDVCSSDLFHGTDQADAARLADQRMVGQLAQARLEARRHRVHMAEDVAFLVEFQGAQGDRGGDRMAAVGEAMAERSEEHTSELQSLMRISYAVFCLKKKNLLLLINLSTL